MFRAALGTDSLSRGAAAVFVLTFVPAVGYFITTYLKSRKYKFPPLVPGLPIVGNTFQVPVLHQGEWAKALAEKYGEM